MDARSPGWISELGGWVAEGYGVAHAAQKIRRLVGAAGGVPPVGSPMTGSACPSITAPRSGATPVKPSVMLGITAPEFLGAVPIAKVGVYLTVISVEKSLPNVIVVVQGLAVVMLSF